MMDSHKKGQADDFRSVDGIRVDTWRSKANNLGNLQTLSIRIQGFRQFAALTIA